MISIISAPCGNCKVHNPPDLTLFSPRPLSLSLFRERERERDRERERGGVETEGGGGRGGGKRERERENKFEAKLTRAMPGIFASIYIKTNAPKCLFPYLIEQHLYKQLKEELNNCLCCSLKLTTNFSFRSVLLLICSTASLYISWMTLTHSFLLCHALVYLQSSWHETVINHF